MKINKLYIGGEFLDTGNYLDIIFPYNGEIIGKVSLAGEKEIDLAIEKAENSLEEMKKLEPFKKAEILNFIAKELENNLEEFAKTLCLENGKTINESRLEIKRSISTFEIAAGESTRIEGEYMNLGVNSMSIGRHGIVKNFPIGVVAGIAPFNFPMNLAVHKIAPAIASGCPIILKPASKTPLTMLMLAEIISKSNLPKGAFSVVPSDRKIGQKLVESEKIKLLSFTGSPDIGWKMKKECGKKKVVLELGGNAGVIIDKDFKDFDYLIERCILGSFYQAGQVCISVQRILIQEEIYEKFKKNFLEKIKEIKVGDPRKEDITIGGIIDEKNKKRIVEWVLEAETLGANILCGNSGEGTILNPTVLENVSKTCNLGVEEVFGPVVCLEKFGNFDEAIEKVNNSKFGLQVGVFSKNIDKIWKCFEEIEVGGVIQNDVPSFRVDSMPYGGLKDSGLGREGVKYAIKDMLEEKVLVLKT